MAYAFCVWPLLPWANQSNRYRSDCFMYAFRSLPMGPKDCARVCRSTFSTCAPRKARYILVTFFQNEASPGEILRLKISSNEMPFNLLLLFEPGAALRRRRPGLPNGH